MLATLGRNGADITLRGASISRIQCAFELHETTAAILLWDRSSTQSTQFHGDTAVPFELGRSPRRVVITPQTNLEFGFGGADCSLFMFRIFWHHEHQGKPQSLLVRYLENSCDARTIDDVPTALPSRRITRIHTGVAHNRRIRWQKKVYLGRGSYGEVVSAVDMATGDDFAVKKVKGGISTSYTRLSLKREVETLASLSHPNILEYVGAQDSEDLQSFEIITALKNGSVEDLIQGRDAFVINRRLGHALLRDLLQAVDYLAHRGMLHRDIKPANILYASLSDGRFQYQLADFGLCNYVAEAQTCVGTRLFMAPELESSPGAPQTSKMDVWSIFATLVYAMNASGFREKPMHPLENRITAIQDATHDPGFGPIREMALVDPNLRASAGDMLDKHFAGQGRTTTRHQHVGRRSRASAAPLAINEKPGVLPCTIEATRDGPPMPSFLPLENPRLKKNHGGVTKKQSKRRRPRAQ